ncbi:hypothetical protein K402DRAFT_377649 [Aulographum hederae CBS 113979]|uniref:Copper homeostasis protein cutC homolog n=1 Tax=Aulographum hederae CBS 113979 TaxID=1176131 RepID=A0A6G1GZR2_9PEZI|nr:hypothetical protein K402DRAFT_377649 [Aulographum hederae CBS 113979]
MPLEIACFTPTSAITAITAITAGADRIELCASYHLGGVTPPLSWLEQIKSHFANCTSEIIPINVMLRPRCGDFFYTSSEFDQMRDALTSFADAGADGFVFGILTENGDIDAERNTKLVQLASVRGKSCTFHRAFDGIDDGRKIEALNTLVECGFEAVLTSGTAGAEGAIGGVEVLGRLVEAAEGRIEVVVGGGVRSGNLGGLRGTGARWFHSAAMGEGEEVDEVEVGRLRELVER